MSQEIREARVSKVSQEPEENRLVREAVNYTPPPPKRSPNPYQPDKTSKPEEWRKG
jgi:hypothetical protein